LAKYCHKKNKKDITRNNFIHYDIEVKLFLAISDALQHDFIDDLRPSDKKSDLDVIFDTLKLLVEEKLKKSFGFL